MRIRKRRTKGTLKLLIAIVVMMSIVIFGILGMTVDFHKHAQKKYNEKSEFDKANLEKVDVVKIHDIYPTRLTIDDSKFYIIDTGYYYVMLEAEPNDKDFKKFITTKKEDLKEEEFYFSVNYMPQKERKSRRRSGSRTVANVDNNLSLAFLSEYKTTVPKEKQGDKTFIFYSYVSLTEERESNTIGFSFFIVLAVISLILSYVVYYKIKQNILNYDKIESDYPELSFDFKDINNNLSYSDNALKVAIYKNGIIYYRNKFYYESFDNILSIDLNLSVREIIITKSDKDTYSIPLMINIKKKNSNKNKEQKEQAIKFMKYLRVSQPNITLKY